MEDSGEVHPPSRRRAIGALLLVLIFSVAGVLVAALLRDPRPAVVPERNRAGHDLEQPADTPKTHGIESETNAPKLEVERRVVSLLVRSWNGDAAVGARVRIGVLQTSAQRSESDPPPPLEGVTAADGRWIAKIPAEWPEAELAASGTSADETEATRCRRLFGIGDSLEVKWSER